MSSDESVSPVLTLRRAKKISSTASKSTPFQLRDKANKLSLKRIRNAKENVDPFRTPDNTALNRKVSASFIFSSCKKKQLDKRDSLLGHSILVGDSSDEEFINCDSLATSTNANQNADVVDESLVEYSLIRKWLQNAEDSFSSVDVNNFEDDCIDSDSSSKDQEILNRVRKFKISYASTTDIKNNTVVLSSDDESVGPESAQQKIKFDTTRKLSPFEFNTTGQSSPVRFNTIGQSSPVKFNTIRLSSPKSSDSMLGDSFDSPCITKSLGEKLSTREKPSCHDKESSSESDSFLRISKPFKKPVVLRISSDDEVSSSPERLPRKPFPTRPVISSTKYFSTPPTTVILSESELEDVFSSLTIDKPPAPIVKPKKLVKSRQKKKGECDTIFRQPALKSERSFLASLSSEIPQECRHFEAIPYMKNFRKTRDELTNRLFQMFNKEIFNNFFHHDFSITWNGRLTRTAGYCRHFTKRENGIITFESRIELSVKVVDTPCRLRDTLIHELCHAATWIIDNCRGGHGPVWRKWANQALHTFPELPPITRCHNYEISYKFYYNCVSCKYSAGRHSKSIDTSTHVCPVCRGQLQLSKEPSSRVNENAEVKPKDQTPRTPNAFALFVKENYAAVKSSRTDLPHAAVMKLLSAKYAESKLKLV